MAVIERTERLAKALGPLHTRVQKMYADSISENFFEPKFVVLSHEDYKLLADTLGYTPQRFMGLTILNETSVG